MSDVLFFIKLFYGIFTSLSILILIARMIYIDSQNDVKPIEMFLKAVLWTVFFLCIILLSPIVAKYSLTLYTIK